MNKKEAIQRLNDELNVSPPVDLDDVVTEDITDQDVPTMIKEMQAIDAPKHSPPAYGKPEHGAVGAVVDRIVGDLCKDIGSLRHLLDDLEQQVLEGAASAKIHLAEQLSLCGSVKDELTHMRSVIDTISEREKTARAGRG